MLVLGMETSCDETAAAVVEDGVRVRSSVVASQHDLHGPFGGVVPELACRRHISSVIGVVEEALRRASVGLPDIKGVAVTRGPGLIGALLVGLSAAKSIAYARRIPIVGVHHIEGHLAAIFMETKAPPIPFLGLVVSGGHTMLFRVMSPGSYRILGQTRDDAAGEAFDKVAKLLGLGYPGGPAIDRLARGGNPAAISFPRPIPAGLEFSFSGLKTAVAQWISRNTLPKASQLADLVASFQEAVVDTLVTKLFAAAKLEGLEHLVVCGGVACNSRLRARLGDEAARLGFQLYLSAPEYCTDNAAMIAAAGFPRLKRGETDTLDLNAEATIPLPA